MKNILVLAAGLVSGGLVQRPAAAAPLTARAPQALYLPAGPGNGPPFKEASRSFSRYAASLFRKARLAASGLSESVFSKALTGYFNLCRQGKLGMDRAVLTIIDFHVPSVEKRLWVIDLNSGRLLLHTWVAQGQGSGKKQARRFSNHMGSHESSLGFYLTGERYQGAHGTSLKLIGLDPGFNSDAAARHIVIHPADYVTASFIQRYGYLGRSFGCPAVPPGVSDSLIHAIQDRTLLFIDGPDLHYHSRYLNRKQAALAAEKLLSLPRSDPSGRD